MRLVYGLWVEVLVRLIGAVVCLMVALQVQLFAGCIMYYGIINICQSRGGHSPVMIKFPDFPRHFKGT